MSVELTDLGDRDVRHKVHATLSAPERTKSELDSIESQSMSDQLNNSECNSCGSGSTCTVLQCSAQRELNSDDEVEDDQILSIRNLPSTDPLQSPKHQDSYNSRIDEALEEVNLNLEKVPDCEIANNLPSDSTMFATYSHTSPRALQQNSNQFSGFSEVQPRLCFASQRVKEYFESFKSHSGEKANLYQFFKSTRTELVACLIFTIITSQALIVCRTQLQDGHTSFVTSDKKGEAAEALALYTLQPSRSNQVAVHLVSGLLTSFTVATLTQIFGHISGCHLIPSVSLALYVKGHISRARLASYLLAQSTGSFLGVSLLSLLTTSQLSLEEYKELLLVRGNIKYTNLEGGSMALASHQQQQHERRRREVSDDIEDINLNDIEGSETILLSIAEQQQQQQQQRRHLDSRVSEERTITTNVSTYQVPQKGSAASPEPASNQMALPSDQQSVAEVGLSSAPAATADQQALRRRVSELHVDDTAELQATRSLERSGDGTANDKSRVSHDPPTKPAESVLLTLDSVGKISTLNSQNRQLSPPSPLSSLQHNQHGLTKSELDNHSSIRPNIKLRRKKRNRQQANATASPSTTVPLIASLPDGSLNSKYYINMLKFTLPDSIMSSESIRQCIDKQQIDDLTTSKNNNNQQQSMSILSLAARSFTNCLSLSNSSQMFVFQLIATLLIVLTYLVNVEPRRVDLGFKSLSIGLSYFVASILTVHSGGYFGNPSQLMFLTWLTPSSEWQSEWIIYLITPFIGGLFGAMSHEYIDYTSPPNRSKELHLRRSFYSLDNLQCQGSGSGGNVHVKPDLTDTAVEIPTLGSNSRRERRRVSSNSSLESNGGSSSVLTLAGPSEQDQQQQQHLNSVIENRGTNRKLISYARQVRMEQRAARQLQAANGGGVYSNQVGRTSFRRSDFDSNFLISSSPRANARKINANGFM